MTPYETISKKYTLPFPLYPFQQEGVNDLGPIPSAGYYYDTGTGKSITSTVSSLLKREEEKRKTLVLVPPILIRGWKRMLDRIPEIEAATYEGTPKERSKIKLGADFTVMSLYTFKRDYDSVLHRFGNTPLNVIVDEATSIKSIASDNHKAVRGITVQKDATLMLLTGTPLSTPIDAYAYTKLVAPGTYRNLHHFENTHVASRDFYGNVTGWRNLDLLAENMKINAKRVLREEVLKDLPATTYTPMLYDLDAAHYRLYKRLAEEQLLELEGGGKIDATTAPALYHALQQIVVNYDHFADNDQLRSRAYDLIDEVMSELNGKLVLVGGYRMTNRKVIAHLAKYGVVGAFGDLSPKQQADNVERFIRDPDCRVIVLQPQSAGYGIDGLQEVCHDMLFLEMPVVPAHFHQVVARLHRNGQHNPTHIRVAVADRTLQVRLFNNMMQKDALINRIQGGFKDLKASLFGG